MASCTLLKTNKNCWLFSLIALLISLLVVIRAKMMPRPLRLYRKHFATQMCRLWKTLWKTWLNAIKRRWLTCSRLRLPTLLYRVAKIPHPITSSQMHTQSQLNINVSYSKSCNKERSLMVSLQANFSDKKPRKHWIYHLTHQIFSSKLHKIRRRTIWNI